MTDQESQQLDRLDTALDRLLRDGRRVSGDDEEFEGLLEIAGRLRGIEIGPGLGFFGQERQPVVVHLREAAVDEERRVALRALDAQLAGAELGEDGGALRW
jgi:hypothetical protein